jgi:hypothetical protein
MHFSLLLQQKKLQIISGEPFRRSILFEVAQKKKRKYRLIMHWYAPGTCCSACPFRRTNQKNHLPLVRRWFSANRHATGPEPAATDLSSGKGPTLQISGFDPAGITFGKPSSRRYWHHRFAVAYQIGIALGPADIALANLGHG